MVDLHESNRYDANHKNRDGKVKILMDRTPSFIKSKILSVLGSSNDLISGITTKVIENQISLLQNEMFALHLNFSVLIFG